MMYSSSPQTFVFKSVFPFLMIGGGILGFMVLRMSDDIEASNFANGFGVALFWVAIFLVQMPFRLKKIEIDQNAISIKSQNGVDKISYKDIISVAKFDLSNPWMITISYNGLNKNTIQKISYMPNSKYQRFMEEDEMTSFLVENSKLHNPNFVQVSTIRNMIVLFLTALPFAALSLYFIMKS